MTKREKQLLEALNSLRAEYEKDFDFFPTKLDYLRHEMVTSALFDLIDNVSRVVMGPDMGINKLLDQWTLHKYRPTLRPETCEFATVLAEGYDLIALARGLEQRAYRGLKETRKREKLAAENKLPTRVNDPVAPYATVIYVGR